MSLVVSKVWTYGRVGFVGGWEDGGFVKLKMINKNAIHKIIIISLTLKSVKWNQFGFISHVKELKNYRVLGAHLVTNSPSFSWGPPGTLSSSSLPMHSRTVQNSRFQRSPVGYWSHITQVQLLTAKWKHCETELRGQLRLIWGYRDLRGRLRLMWG